MFHSKIILIGFLCHLAYSLAYKVERITASPRADIGEVPHWDVENQCLYYVNIAGSNSSLLRYDFQEDRVYGATIDNTPNLRFIMPIKCSPNRFLVGIGLKATIVEWNGISSKASIVRTLFEIDEPSSNIFNDVKTDAKGRFYGGTKCVPTCFTSDSAIATSSFYTYSKGKGLRKIFGGAYISNGLTWVRSTRKFYHIDSCAYNLKEFNYNKKTGKLSKGHPVFSIGENGTEPDPSKILDGMTNDCNGNLYMAVFGGSKIIVFNPQKQEVIMEIALPATQITSITFGGPKMDTLFVTTANDDGLQPEASGYLYKVTELNATGYTGVRVNV